MAFTIKTWVDRLAEFPNRRRLEPTGIENTYDVVRAEGNVAAEGDKFDAATMNDLEQRIAAGFSDTVQGATIGGEAVPKNDGVLDFPMPTAAQVGALPAALKDVSGTITDFCQLITPGRYRMMNATANCPPGCTSGDNDYIVHVDNPVTVPANGYVIQMVYDIRSLSIWIHKCINGTWYWQKPDANSANFASGTVALTTPALRNTVISNVEPSGGSDGDTWDMY